MPKLKQNNCCATLLFERDRPPTLVLCALVLLWTAEFTTLVLLCWLLGWTVHRGFRLEPADLPHYALRYFGCWLLVCTLLASSALLTVGRWVYYSFRRTSS
jgi:hypothetical protein